MHSQNFISAYDSLEVSEKTVSQGHGSAITSTSRSAELPKSLKKITSIRNYHSCFMNRNLLIHTYLSVTWRRFLSRLISNPWLATKCSLTADIAFLLWVVKPQSCLEHKTTPHFKGPSGSHQWGSVRYGSSHFLNVNRSCKITSWYSRWK